MKGFGGVSLIDPNAGVGMDMFAGGDDLGGTAQPKGEEPLVVFQGPSPGRGDSRVEVHQGSSALTGLVRRMLGLAPFLVCQMVWVPVALTRTQQA